MQPEIWYQAHSKAIREIRIVPFEEHSHALVVPNFSWLREQKHVNTREFIRFEFQDLSKQLPVEQRPDTFSLTSEPLSREELNLELDLGFDSLDRVLLISAIEKTFGIQIPDAEAAQLFTVRDLMRTVKREDIPLTTQPSSWSELLHTPLTPQERSMADSILKRRPLLTFTAWTMTRLIRLVKGRCWPLQVDGREHIPRKGAFLLASNHCSHLDPLFLLWSLPLRVARRLSFLGHTEYFGSGWKAFLAKRLKLVPVDPDEHARSGMRLSAEALRRGFIGCVFPEGERSPNGALQRFHKGIAILACELRVPVVPAAILGTYEVFPRLAEHIRCGPVQVRFGSAIRTGRQESVENVLARLWKAIRDLRGSDAQAREPVPDLLDIY